MRRDLIREFTHGIWKSVQEFGSRDDDNDEPCVMCLNYKQARHGLLPYQAAYLLFYDKVPSKGECLSHRCRNVRNTTSTRCCTVSHMLIKNQKENRSRFKDHAAIIKKANSKQASQSEPMFGAQKVDNCSHKGPDGKEYCIVNFFQNTNVSDSVPKYVLKQ